MINKGFSRRIFGSIREDRKQWQKEILGFTSDFLYAESQEEARLMVTGNRGFLPIEAVGRLPELSGSIKRIPLYRKKRRITRKYCLFWQKEKTGYYIEEFARILQSRLGQVDA